MRRNAHPAQKAPHPEVCGFTHDSMTERDYCERLHLLMRTGESNIVYIEVFPVVMIQKGERWKLDFCVHYSDQTAPTSWRQYIDVKGRTTGHVWSEFQRKRKVFDREHPDAPLVAVKRKGKGWIEV